MQDIDPVEEASEESFPASDPPAWAMGGQGAALNNPARNRFELTIGENIAFLEYRLETAVLTLAHTEVPEAMRSNGSAGKLVRAALEFARHEGIKVRLECPFAASYVRRHAEFSDLIAKA
jgi:predicted GNAT family acetyltransferase